MTALADAFRCQAEACEALGSPFMAQLCALLADRLAPGSPLTDRLFAWQGDLSPRGESLPLRLCGALNALRLNGNSALAPVYPPLSATDDALWQAVQTCLMEDATFIDSFITSPPQTNEVRRAAVLIAAAHVIAERVNLPIRLSELGASAGLNLNFDQFALRIGEDRWGSGDAAVKLAPDWSGPRPPHSAPRVIERRGVDLNPLDPAKDALRLRAYLWPDQAHRLALTDAAIALPPAPVDRADAIDWLASRLPHVTGQTHLIYTTIAWQYFPAEKRAHGLRQIKAAGATATHDTPLAFFQMENDGGKRGAAITLRLWPGDLTLSLGRADFHGRWVEWSG